MKALIFGAALLLVSLPTAFAQNQPTTNDATAPGSINHAGTNVPGLRIAGHSQYCAQVSATSLRCRYRTMASCKKAAGNSNLSCVANPRMAVGSAPRR